METLRHYQKPLFWAVLLHIALLALFFISFDSAKEAPGKPVEPQPETIQASMANEGQIQQELTKLQEKERAKQQQQQALELKRQEEEKHLEELKALGKAAEAQAAKKLEELQQKLALAERQRHEEEKRLAELESRRKEESKRKEEAEKQRQEEEKRLVVLEAKRQEALKKAADENKAEEQQRLAEQAKFQTEAKASNALKKKAEAEAKQKAEQRQAEEAKRKEDEASRQKAEAEAKRKTKAEAEAKAAEEDAQRKAAEETKRQAGRVRVLKEQLEAEGLAMSAKQAALDQAKAKAMAAIKQKVQSNWIRPPSAGAGLSCKIRVRLMPGGDVADAKAVESECNGDAAFHQSAEAAVLRASPLPMPSEPELQTEFREFEFRFKP